MRSRSTILFSILITLTVGLFLLDLAVGAVNIPIRDVWAALTGGNCSRATEKIVLNIRLIKAIVALLAGAALSVSGLQMQTLFRNPLAGPYVLGISSGASLGVALVVLAGIGSSIGIAGAAWVGAAVVLLVITAVGQRIKDIMVILILGMMFSSGVGAVVQILQYLSKEESLKAFVIWTMGALGDVTSGQLLILVPSVFAGLLLAVLTIKPLNLLLFGEEYAVTMGLNIRRSRSLLFLSTTLLAGTITAFCGPYVLGISSGASLGVALVVLAGIGSSIGIAGAAWVGAAVVLLVITAVGQRIKDIMVILILGMMFSSGVGAVVQILQYLSKEESLKAFVIWTMGALGDVTSGQLLILVPSVFAGLLLAVLTIKPLNLLLFGEEYAVTMGLNIRRSRSLLFLSTTLLAGTITAFCGPIGFIGLAMPHVTRMLFQNSDHHVLLPGTILSGASILLLCDIISKIFTLPINAITALLGIPIVVWVVLRNKSITA